MSRTNRKSKDFGRLSVRNPNMQEPAGLTRCVMGICAVGWSGWRRAVPVERCGDGAASAFEAGIWYQVR